MGRYKYDRDYRDAPAYKRTTSPSMYLFWYGNRWVMEGSLGDVTVCNPWWAFWNCQERHGWIRYNGDYVCPENVASTWKSAYTQSVEPAIAVTGASCSNSGSTTTTAPGM